MCEKSGLLGFVFKDTPFCSKRRRHFERIATPYSISRNYLVSFNKTHASIVPGQVIQGSMSTTQSRRLRRDIWHDQSGIIPTMALPTDNRYYMNTKVHSLPQKNQCAVCKTQQKITVCTGCRVAHYCGSAHQKLGWAKHKWLCKAVRVSIGHVAELTADVKREIEAS